MERRLMQRCRALRNINFNTNHYHYNMQEYIATYEYKTPLHAYIITPKS